MRVVQQYGWSHSLALGSDLPKAYKATPVDAPFILHACEGIDARAEEELAQLNRLGLLGTRTCLFMAWRSTEPGSLCCEIGKPRSSFVPRRISSCLIACLPWSF